MASKIELDLRVQEVLKLSHDLGYRDGMWEAFSSVHHMLQALGYGMEGEMGIRLRDLSRKLEAPINEFGNAYEEEDHALADEGEGGDYFAHVRFQGADYIDTDGGWVPVDPGYRNPTNYRTAAEAQDAADRFLAKRQAEKGD